MNLLFIMLCVMLHDVEFKIMSISSETLKKRLQAIALALNKYPAIQPIEEIENEEEDIEEFYENSIQSDPQKTFERYSLAAAQNHADALYRLGQMLEHTLFKRSQAKPGVFEVKELIALDGTKIELPNIQEAIRYYRLAAGLGHSAAAYILAGADLNAKKSLKEIENAVDERDREEKEAIEEFYEGPILSMQPTVIVEIVEGHEKTPVDLRESKQKEDKEEFEVLPISSTQPTQVINTLQEEQSVLGKKVLLDFKKLPKAIQEQVTLNVEKAELGYVSAQYTVGELYEKHLGDNIVGIQGAFKGYSLAADRGDLDAQYRLGCIYQNVGGKISGQKWLVYNDEIILLPNLEMALYWFNRAAEKGHMYAQYSLAKLYEANSLDYYPIRYNPLKDSRIENKRVLDAEETDIKLPNIAKALQWYNQAAAQGHIQAKAAMERLQSVEAGKTVAVLLRVEKIISAEWAMKGKQWNLSAKDALNIFLRKLTHKKYEQLSFKTMPKDSVRHISPVSVWDILIAYGETFSSYEAALLLVEGGMLLKEKLAGYKERQIKDSLKKTELAAVQNDLKTRLDSNANSSPKLKIVAKDTLSTKWQDSINTLLEEIKKVDSEEALLTSLGLSVDTVAPFMPACASIQVESKPSVEESTLQKLQSVQENQAFKISTAEKEILNLQGLLASKEIEIQDRTVMALREQEVLSGEIIKLRSEMARKDTEIMLLRHAQFKEEISESLLAKDKLQPLSNSALSSPTKRHRDEGDNQSPTKKLRGERVKLR
jgi:TPR repeat protein